MVSVRLYSLILKLKQNERALSPRASTPRPFCLWLWKFEECLLRPCLHYTSEAQFPIAVHCCLSCVRHLSLSHALPLILWQLYVDFNLVKDHCLGQKQFMRSVFIKSNGFRECDKDARRKQAEIIVLVFSHLLPLFPRRGGTGKRKLISTRKWNGTGASPIFWFLWSQRPCKSLAGSPHQSPGGCAAPSSSVHQHQAFTNSKSNHYLNLILSPKLRHLPNWFRHRKFHVHVFNECGAEWDMLSQACNPIKTQEQCKLGLI